MTLYIARDLKRGTLGRVFHLQGDCPQCAKGHIFEVATEADVAVYRKVFGIRRICLRCRKVARKAMRTA